MINALSRHGFHGVLYANFNFECLLRLLRVLLRARARVRQRSKSINNALLFVFSSEYSISSNDDDSLLRFNNGVQSDRYESTIIVCNYVICCQSNPLKRDNFNQRCCLNLTRPLPLRLQRVLLQKWTFHNTRIFIKYF